MLVLAQALLAADVSWRNVTWPIREQQYSYALDVLETNGTRFAFSCENVVPGVVRDHVVLRLAQASGGADPWQFGAPITVLSPGSNSSSNSSSSSSAAREWDALHTCDPDVVASRGAGFRLGGALFRYALFYTGIGSDGDPDGNSIGVAVAHNLAGPWLKRPNGPLVRGRGGWGVGQPSAVVLWAGGAGRVGGHCGHCNGGVGNGNPGAGSNIQVKP